LRGNYRLAKALSQNSFSYGRSVFSDFEMEPKAIGDVAALAN
jgi:hypothetical protein